MALWTIGILLIIVIGLSSTYIREMKLSRTSYDEVLAYANAEGMFEYAMLKTRNHREGFEDIVLNSDLDWGILVPVTDRSKWMKSTYEINSSSTNETFILNTDNHLIIPLFSAPWVSLSGLSKKPNPDATVKKVQNLSVGLSQLTWTIVAMSGSESIGLTGTGNISPTKEWTIRLKSTQCYDAIDWSSKLCSQLGSWDEEIDYFYDESSSVAQFVETYTDPYLMVFNDSLNPQVINITSNTPFSLPTISIRAEAQKNDSVQVFELTEDKSRYYDALKYGVYNAN